MCPINGFLAISEAGISDFATGSASVAVGGYGAARNLAQAKAKFNAWGRKIDREQQAAEKRQAIIEALKDPRIPMRNIVRLPPIRGYDS